jgi:hypothetical protein
MATVERGVVEVPVLRLWPAEPMEYALAVLRLFARKEIGEPLDKNEQEAAQFALTMLDKEW